MCIYVALSLPMSDRGRCIRLWSVHVYVVGAHVFAIGAFVCDYLWGHIVDRGRGISATTIRSSTAAR